MLYYVKVTKGCTDDNCNGMFPVIVEYWMKDLFLFISVLDQSVSLAVEYSKT
jgi:hypothetical protein